MIKKFIEGNPHFSDILIQCHDSMEVFCKTFFPERFELPFCDLHRSIFNLLDGEEQRVAIIAPRGIGKTSMMIAYMARTILFQDRGYIVFVSNSAAQAIEKTEELKQELLSNEVVKKIFGQVKSERSEDEFSRMAWVTSTGIRVLPRGGGQQVRGLLFKSGRPDLVIFDDFEDAESVMSEEQRAKKKKWFYSDALRAIDRSKTPDKTDKFYRMIFDGTILHEDSLLNNIQEDPLWDSTKLSLITPEVESKWPEQISTEEIQKEMEAARETGTLEVFYMELANEIVPGELAVFPSKYFQYYEESESNLNDNPDIQTVILVDPAKTQNPRSADSAVIGVGVDVVSHAIYVRDIVSGKFTPDELYDEIFKMASDLKAWTIGVEVNSLNNFITYPLKNEMAARNLPYALIDLKPRDKKENRVKQLVPFYRRGFVYHNKRCSSILEQQLMSFPRSKKWDVMDAFAYIVPMLDEGDRYFLPTGSIEHEYDSLDRMEPLPNDWRTM